MKATFSTEAFELAHGQKPSSREPGMWAFDLFRDDEMTTVFCPGTVKLAEAKKWVIREARTIGGIIRIEVAS